MSWIDYRKPSAEILADTDADALEGLLTERLQNDPDLEVHFSTDEDSFYALLIDRGSINYRPEKH